MTQGNSTNKDMHKLSYKLPILALLTLGSCLASMTITRADDTEVFTAYTPTSKSSNVVFVLDTSGSMNQKPSNGFSSNSKIQIVKDVFESLIFDKDANGIPDHSKVNPMTAGINIGVMRFNDGGNGGYFISNMAKLDNSFKDTLWTAVSGLTANGNTPLAESAYEAYLYFAGEAPLYGAGKYTDPSVANIMNGNSYRSPFSDPNIATQCSINNHLVVLTDGKPNGDGNADTAIHDLTGSTCSYASNNDCLPQVAKYLHDHDFYKNDSANTVQNVITHTIAFDLNDTNAMTLLSTTATNGGGMAAKADDASGLAKAIQGIFTNVVDTATSFVSPAVSVSSSNRFVNDNTVYFGLFKPKVTPLWPGNVKGYRVDYNGVLKDFSNDDISKALDALNPNNPNEFNADAVSKWTSTSDPDGNDITKGGAASQILAQSTRTILTQDLDTPTKLIDLTALKTNTQASSTQNNAINAEFDPDGTGAITISNTERDAIIDWATSKTKNPILDPLHSTPQVINYSDGSSVIFISTNGGFLHAIDTETGEEKFSFIPTELLKHLKILKDNQANQDHVYGLDGQLTVYKDGGSVTLIVGMRRGGSSYYALDVSNPSDPSLKWQISSKQTDFAAMGQTWAKPIVTKLNFGNINNPTTKTVVLLSGGYDTQYDTLGAKINTPKGNAIYAVNLASGDLEWNAGKQGSTTTDTHLYLSEMNDAIPSEVSAIDINSDGIADRLYAIDITGRIFRIDFNTTAVTSGNTLYRPSGKLFANLSGDNRHFYYSVDVAFNQVGTQPILHISAGSGMRPNPLNMTTSDSFFSVWDRYAKIPLPADFSPITIDNLVDTTTPGTAVIDSGWYITLNTKEKVLSGAVSLSGYVFFTTYTPPSPPNTLSCDPPLGQGKLYAVSLYDSQPLSNERFVDLKYMGIPPSPTFMTLDTSSPNNTGPDTRRLVLVGGQDPLSDADKDKLNLSDTSRTYWQIVN